MIAVGILPLHLQFIPQEMIKTINGGCCISDCTQTGLSNICVTLFASIFHSHTAGIPLNLRHVRNDTELPPIDSNWNYDFNYQTIVSLGDGVNDGTIVMSGDDLILDCYYDASGRNDITYGGQATINAYPKPQLRKCLTTISIADIEKWFWIGNEKGFVDRIDEEEGDEGNEMTADDDSTDSLMWCATGTFIYYSNINGAKEYYNLLWNTEIHVSIQKL